MITRVSPNLTSRNPNATRVAANSDKGQHSSSISSPSPQSDEFPAKRSDHTKRENSEGVSVISLASRQTEIPSDREKEFCIEDGKQHQELTFANEFSDLRSDAFGTALSKASEIAASRTDQQLLHQLHQLRQQIEPLEENDSSSSNQDLEALEESIFMAIHSIENAAANAHEKLNHNDACAVTARTIIYHVEKQINNEYRLLIHPFIDLLSNEFEEAALQVITNEGPDSPIASHCDALLNTSKLDRLNDPIYRRLIYEILERLNVATTARFMTNQRLSMEEAASIATRTIRKFFARELYKNNNVVINVNGDEVGFHNGFRAP